MKHIGIGILILLSIVPHNMARAHHGFSNFDQNTEIHITGTITEIAFINPHSWLYLDVPNENGSSAWKCELRSATLMRRSGWSKDMFRLGSMVSITGSPDRFEDNTCYLATIIFDDGSSIDRYGQLIQAVPPLERARPLQRLANGDPIIAGDWVEEQGVMTDPTGRKGAFLPLSVASDLEPGAIPPGTQAFPASQGTPLSFIDNPVEAYWSQPPLVPLTAAGEKALEGFDGASTDNPRLRCEPTNIIFDWTYGQQANRIVQNENEIILYYGFMGLERVIHLDEARFPDFIEPTISGYSIGRWENDVLVVQTRGFIAGVLSADRPTMHSDQMQIIERFRLNENNSALLREYTVEDALFFQEAHTGNDIVIVADLEYEPDHCDERSYRSDR